MYIIPLLLSFFFTLVGLSLGSPISNYIDTLELYYGEKYGIENTLFSSFISALHSLVHWVSWSSFADYTWPFISGVLIGLVLLFFPEIHGIKVYGYLAITVVIAGFIVYFFPTFFNNTNGWVNIIIIPLSTLCVIGGIVIVQSLSFLFKHIVVNRG
ncbi:MAG: hypothetical protein KBC41_01515 [Candidatus Pacebacteria bacterium]|nr:hypothetical protein [Candidatus Paceibacterota bacterium]